MTLNRSSANFTPGLRIVFDTNIYIAAFLRPGLSEELVRRGLRGEFSVFLSPFILDELEQKLRSKEDFSLDLIQEFLGFIRSGVEVIALDEVSAVILHDPQDDHILACAKKSQAQLLITLDQDLLVLKEWEGIRILHPKTFSWIVPNK